MVLWRLSYFPPDAALFADDILMNFSDLVDLIIVRRSCMIDGTCADVS